MIRFMILSCSAAKAVCLTDNGVWTTTWQNRPLSDIFPIVFIDAIHFSVRGDGIIRKLAAYVVLGINGDGYKGVMTIEVVENENSKYWLGVLNSLKNRGVKDILILRRCSRHSMWQHLRQRRNGRCRCGTWEK